MPWEKGRPPRVVELWCEDKEKHKAGPYRAWDDYGQIITEGNYDGGKPSGLWSYYQKNQGGVTARGIYDAGKRTGRWVLFDDQHKMFWFGDYAAGVPVGKWTWEFVHPNDKDRDMTGSGEVKGGKPVGQWTLPCGFAPQPGPSCGSAVVRAAIRSSGHAMKVNFDRIEKPRRLYFEAR